MPRDTASLFTGRHFIAICSGAMLVYMYGWITRWTFDPSVTSVFRPDYFFTSQADALLRGRLWVDPESFAGSVSGECFYIAEKCYGYFGLTPSILRIPVLLVIGHTTQSLAFFMIPIASSLAFGAALDLCRQFARPMAHQVRGVVFMCVTALTLGPGSVLTLLADARVYEEAIIWSIAGVMLAVNCFWRWLQFGNTRYLKISIFFCIFAAGARPTTILVGVVLGIALFVAHRHQLGLRSCIAVALSFIVLPALFAFGTLFAKFDQPSPPPRAWNNPTSNPEGGTFVCGQLFSSHPKYLPTNLFAYLRPDAVRLYRDWPNVRFRFNTCDGPNHPTYLWPLSVGDMHVERNTSLTNTMPIPLLATGFAAISAVQRRKPKELALLTALATIGLLASSTLGMAARYLGDFYPLLAAGLATSATVLGSAKRKSTLVTLTCIALPLIPWSLLANASLLTRLRWP